MMMSKWRPHKQLAHESSSRNEKIGSLELLSLFLVVSFQDEEFNDEKCRQSEDGFNNTCN
jgi:hypothetical protein